MKIESVPDQSSLGKLCSPTYIDRCVYPEIHYRHRLNVFSYMLIYTDEHDMAVILTLTLLRESYF